LSSSTGLVSIPHLLSWSSQNYVRKSRSARRTEVRTQHLIWMYLPDLEVSSRAGLGTSEVHRGFRCLPTRIYGAQVNAPNTNGSTRDR
jgi:hypothetical protein